MFRSYRTPSAHGSPATELSDNSRIILNFCDAFSIATQTTNERLDGFFCLFSLNGTWFRTWRMTFSSRRSSPPWGRWSGPSCWAAGTLRQWRCRRSSRHWNQNRRPRHRTQSLKPEQTAASQNIVVEARRRSSYTNVTVTKCLFRCYSMARQVWSSLSVEVSLEMTRLESSLIESFSCTNTKSRRHAIGKKCCNCLSEGVFRLKVTWLSGTYFWILKYASCRICLHFRISTLMKFIETGLWK